MHPDSRVQLNPWWIDGTAADQFVARQLSSSMVTSAHLVLGASPRHRSAVVERAPEALANTFGLREFARLATFVDASTLPSEPVARAHALIDEVRLARGLAPPAGPDGDRVPDPMGQSPAAHRHAAELIEDAVQAIVDVIAPPMRVARLA
jgi:protein-tyrosine phosphatase